MEIKYKKNCQLYYDDKEKATFIVKRSSKFMVRNSFKEYELLKEIIGKTIETVAVEKVIDYEDTNNTKAVQYVKLLIDKGILYSHQDRDYPLELEFQNYIISNFDDHYRVLDFISQNRVAIKNDPSLACLYSKMGIDVCNVESMNENVIDHYDILIGDFNDEELSRLAGRERHLIMLKRIDEAYSILYINWYDKALIDQYRKFYINSPSASDFGKVILPINILIHLLENVFIIGSKNLKYITADAAVQLFHLKEIGRDSLKYYDRSLISKKNDLSIIREIEEMTKTDPYFIKETNKENATLCHAPICNYEILFGLNLNNHKSSKYHEDNAKAGILAITCGMEEALSNMNPSECWVCASSQDEYYLKGYIGLLVAAKETKSVCEEVIPSVEIMSLINFIQQCYQKKIKLYYQNKYNNIVGNIYITDPQGYILYKAKNVWQPEEAIKEGLYDIIGRCENGQDLLENDQLTCEESDRANLKDRTTQETLTLLKNYFYSRSILVEEKPWVYQSYFEEAGIHIGSFYIVK
jgi:hypothetical protein